MKFSKKLFFILGLVTLLASLFSSTALAASVTRVVRPATVFDLKVRDDQPATFRLRGTYTCDRFQVTTAVEGKTIIIKVEDVKVRYTGVPCGKTKTFLRDVVIAPLVPGVYTVLVNPDENGKAQKVLRGFIAPVYATPTPAPAP